MPLPFSITGRVVILGSFDLEQTADRLAQALERVKAKRITRADRRIRFTGGIFRLVSNLNLLGAVSSGEMSVGLTEIGVQVDYRLCFVQMFIVVSLMVLGVFCPGVLMAENLTASEAWAILGGFWLWLFGGNVLLTLFRFPRWIRQSVQDTTRSQER